MIRTRQFLAWRMITAARIQDERNNMRNVRTRFRDHFDPISGLSDNEFRQRYRLTKYAFGLLCSELRRFTSLKSTQRISLEIKVLTALFFYATGSYQRPVGVAKHLSQKMCSVYIHEVTQALIHPMMLNRHIKFPKTPAERQLISHRFFTKYGIPGIVGCVDGCHFHIFGPPKEEEHLFYCRKHFHSLNVQMVCDSNYKIINVLPKFGGANHDSFIWENSFLNNYMQSLHQNGESVWLLGNSGYPQRPWLMTPFLNIADGSPEANYNQKHGTARVVIENTFGRLKNRWRCLSKDRVLHYKPAKCAQIIQACCVLYNIALDCYVPEPDMDLDEDRDQASNEFYREPNRATTDLIRGRAMRDHLVRRLMQ